MFVLENLPMHLRDKAIMLLELGINNCAWLDKDALDVIDELTRRSLAILGGDVLRVTDNRIIQSTFDSWYLNKNPEWSWSEYVNKSGDHARNYILSYSRMNEGKNSIFSLVIASKEQFPKLKTKLF